MALFPLLKLSRSFIVLYTSPKGAYKILNQNMTQRYSPNGTFCHYSCLDEIFLVSAVSKSLHEKIKLTIDGELSLILYAAIVSVENNPNILSHKDKAAPLEFTTAQKSNCDQ